MAQHATVPEIRAVLAVKVQLDLCLMCFTAQHILAIENPNCFAVTNITE